MVKVKAMLTILEIGIFSLAPHIELLALSLHRTVGTVKIERDTLLCRDDLLDG